MAVKIQCHGLSTVSWVTMSCTGYIRLLQLHTIMSASHIALYILYTRITFFSSSWASSHFSSYHIL
jgi:hypothetical protein